MNVDCFEYMPKIESSSIDLILTDPPYSISKNSNFNKSSISASDFIKTKYTTHSIDFGDWDKDLNMDILFKEYYRILKPGGTLLIFFDIWKSSMIKEVAEKNKFKQLRVCQWQKSNPVPINSKLNYTPAINDANARKTLRSNVEQLGREINAKYDAELSSLEQPATSESPTKESVTERLNINNPFYRKVEDALVKFPKGLNIVKPYLRYTPQPNK